MPLTVGLGRGPVSAAIAGIPEEIAAAHRHARSDRRNNIGIIGSSEIEKFTG